MAVKGVDVSDHNGNVDFQALKSAGINFVLIKHGYGGDYPHQDDEEFENNVRKAEQFGIPWGTYLFSYATNMDKVQSEIRHTLRLLAGRKPPYGVWYDVETDEQQECKEIVDLCDAYCSAMEKAGYYCGIYSGALWFDGGCLDDPKLDRYDKWAAQYWKECECKKPYGIWQYTDKLFIAGKQFDGNWAYKDYPALTGTKQEEKPMNTKSRVFSEQENSVTQPFGNGHGGVDLGWDTDPETPVIAHSDGTVVFCQTGLGNDISSSGNASYGNCVKLRHPNGWYTLYAHLSTVKVKNGQAVKKGQQIGNMGNTGNSYGNHLHFEVRNSGDDRVDPAPYLAADLPGLPTKEEEEENMTAAEVKKLVLETLAEKNPTYKTLEEVPDYWREDIKELMDQGVIRGNADGALGLTRSEAKAAVIVKRALEKE